MELKLKMFCGHQKWSLLLTILLVLISLVHSANDTVLESQRHHREKRWLSWPVNGGISKVVFSILVPVNLGKFRSFGWAINIQAQYSISANIIYWVDKFKYRNSRDLAAASPNENIPNVAVPRLVKKSTTCDDDVEGDNSRQMLYMIIESLIFRHRKNGSSCLLRTICGIADSPLPRDNGLLGEVVNLIFTPSAKEKIDKKYYEAYEAGKWGADCLNLYPDCPLGDGIFDKLLF